jgi:hypothetical protein
MKHRLPCVLACVLAAATSFAAPVKYYAMELRGGSRVFSVDPPVRKGRVLLFHRYPDGIYMSLSAEEVEKVMQLESAPPPPSGELAPGQTVYVGPALSGPNYQMPPAPDTVVTSAPYDDYGYGYGYGGYWDGGYVPPLPGPPSPRVPSRIGPNGYPILAPPGSPGSVPPPIGPNGFPILSPPPVRIQPAPRRQ